MYPDSHNHSDNSWHAVRNTSVEIAIMIWSEAKGNPAIAQKIWEEGNDNIDKRAATLARTMGEPLMWGDYMYSAE